MYGLITAIVLLCGDQDLSTTQIHQCRKYYVKCMDSKRSKNAGFAHTQRNLMDCVSEKKRLEGKD